MKHLLTAILLTLTATSALAAEPTLPEQFQGAWCGVYPQPKVAAHRCMGDEIADFRIRARGYLGSGSNWSCTFTSIKFNKLRNAVHADATCSHRSGPWKERAIFLLENDTLTALTVELRND